MSTPVAATNLRASSGVVRPFGFGGRLVDFRAGADVADFSFDEDGGVDGLERGDALFGLADVLVDGQRGEVEDDGVEAGAGGLLGFGEGVGVVGVEKDGDAGLFAQAADQGGDLADSHEVTLALGGSDDDGDVELAGGGDDGFEKNEVGDVEVADRHSPLLRLLDDFAQGLHEHTSSWVLATLFDDSAPREVTIQMNSR